MEARRRRIVLQASAATARIEKRRWTRRLAPLDAGVGASRIQSVHPTAGGKQASNLIKVLVWTRRIHPDSRTGRHVKSNRMPTTFELPLRIILVDPPSGVLYCVQRRSRADCVNHTRSDGGNVVFDLTIQVREGGEEPDFCGPFVQGRREGRYIAVLIGTLAGDADSCWTRGAKFWLKGISWPLIEDLRSRDNAWIVGRFIGTARSGAPACATARFVDEGWLVA